MRNIFISFLTVVMLPGMAASQSFSSFNAGIPELKLYNDVILAKEADAIRYPISESDSKFFLLDTDGEQYALGKITLSRAVIILTYYKPRGVAPLGKITATAFSLSGKRISSEAIGVFADFTGMHFRTTLTVSSQPKGAIALTSKVEGLKDNGEVNQLMSNTGIYLFSSKGKITKL
ncbi:MAG: hypothetical protein NTW29_15485 [Bacteroidetes bacterium]|nr:hypothetical protein [Bacteroidota bacterium]